MDRITVIVLGIKFTKYFGSLFVLLLVASSLLFVESAFSSMPAPSVPEFTVKFEAHPYDVPPTYATDPYTGKNVVTEGGYRVENKSITVTIKNQPFNSSVNGTKYYLSYNIRVKGHFEDEWDELFSPTVCTLTEYNSEEFPKASNSEYTVFSISAERYPYGAQLDFQVQAVKGKLVSQLYVPEYMPDHPLAPPIGGHYELGVDFDTPSDWSGTQTVTISAPLSPILYATLIVLVGVASLALVFYIIKRKQSSSTQSFSVGV